jgi:zona occludens toxin
MRMVLVLVLPILTVVVGYFAAQALYKIQTSPEESAKKLSNPNQPNENNNYDNSVHSDKTPYSYVKSHTPEVATLPYTAPIYEEITKPITAPFPAACVYSSKKGCRCYSQQGTAMIIDFPVCINIVQNGVFIDWETNPKREKFELDQQKAQTVIPDNKQPSDNYPRDNRIVFNSDYKASPRY